MCVCPWSPSRDRHAPPSGGCRWAYSSGPQGRRGFHSGLPRWLARGRVGAVPPAPRGAQHRRSPVRPAPALPGPVRPCTRARDGCLRGPVRAEYPPAVCSHACAEAPVPERLVLRAALLRPHGGGRGRRAGTAGRPPVLVGGFLHVLSGWLRALLRPGCPCPSLCPRCLAGFSLRTARPRLLPSCRGGACVTGLSDPPGGASAQAPPPPPLCWLLPTFLLRPLGGLPPPQGWLCRTRLFALRVSQ